MPGSPASSPITPSTAAGIAWLARVGYAAKGIILLTLGLIAARGAVRADRSNDLPVQSGRALHEIHRFPLGSVLVLILAAGLLCYSIWQACRGIIDVEQCGRSLFGRLRRGWYLWLALLNLFLAISAGTLVIGMSHRSAHATTQATNQLQNDLTELFSSHIARHGFIALGISACIYGLVRVTQALFATGQKNTSKWRRRAIRLNRLTQSLIALACGVAAILLGYFNTVDDLGKLRDQYQRILHGQFGRPALVLAAIILIVWGGFCVASALVQSVHFSRLRQLRAAA